MAARAAQGKERLSRLDRMTMTQVNLLRFSKLAGSQLPGEVQEKNPIRLDHLTH
jgi:hypothetical protein